jgi:hypothetical protein
MSWPPRVAVHRTIFVVDVEGFGDPCRTNRHQLAVRDGLYQALDKSFCRAGISWADCHQEDRGDGVFILAPASIPKGVFVESVPRILADELGEHNRTCDVPERIRVRMALHAGEVTFDDNGVTATAINHTFRLLEAQLLKAALKDSPGLLAMITSNWFFDEVVRNSSISDPATYRPVPVEVKETRAVGWVSLPDHPYEPDTRHLRAPRPSLPRRLLVPSVVVVLLVGLLIAGWSLFLPATPRFDRTFGSSGAGTGQFNVTGQVVCRA